MGAPYSSAPQ